MKITLPAARLELIVGKNDVRKPLEHVYVDIPKNKRHRAQLVATNGHMLVAVPLAREQADALGPGYLSTEMLALCRKHGHTIDTTDDGRIVIGNSVSIVRPTVADVGQFPNWRRVVPKQKSRARLYDFCINAEYLVLLQRALVGDKKRFAGLNCWLPRDDNGHVSKTRAILVTAIGDRSGAFGLLMPMKGDDDRPASAYVSEELARAEKT